MGWKKDVNMNEKKKVDNDDSCSEKECSIG
jgi:hypothetical protein